MKFKIKKGYSSESKTVRLPVKLIKRLESLAFRNNISFNKLANQCLEYALDKLIDNDDKTDPAL